MLTRSIYNLPQPVRRVVSLVPALTESLLDLGLGENLVGVTENRPAAAAELTLVGRTERPDIDAILRLQPDLILANAEETPSATLDELSARGTNVWLTSPQSISATLDVLRDIAALFASRRALQQVDALERSLEWARAAAESLPNQRYFCPVRQEESADGAPQWTTFNAQTYTDDLLALFGGENVFAGREARHLRVSLEEIEAAQPEIILLPSAPFDEARRAALQTIFANTPAGKNSRLYFVDGRLLFWQGTQLAKALQHLPALFTKGQI